MTAPRPVALVTGATRGIGLGIARSLAAADWNLAVNGRREAVEVEAILEELRSAGADAAYLRADVADTSARAQMLDGVRERFGRLDLLVNNAGITSPSRGELLDATEESFDTVMGVNLRGPYFLTQAVARWMIEQRAADRARRLCIVNVSSVSAVVASPNRGDYCLSKAGLAMATQVFAVRLAEHDIPVYELRPGLIDTDMTAGAREEYDAQIDGGLLLEKRWGQPEDVGRAVLALARGDLPYATGQVITQDGGLTLRRL